MCSSDLKGVKLSIARDALPEPGDNEFYHTDLIGLRAETPEGEALGQVRGVYNFGAGDVIEIEAEGEPSQMVPFTQSAVPTIDIAGGRIVVDLPKDGDDA